MESFKKSLAGLFAVLFVMSAVFALLLFNFDRRGFSAETYHKAFAKDDFYNRLPTVLAEAMITTDQSQLPIAMSGMDMQAWDSFFRTILAPDALTTMGDGLLNSTFAYLNQQADIVQLSLVPLKTSMVGPSGVQAIYGILGAQPDCTLMQLAQMGFDLISGGSIQFCNPPAELEPVMTPAIQAQLQVAVTLIPDQITVYEAPLQNDPRQKLQIARLFMRLSPILPLVFLLLMTIFAVNTFTSWLTWWGASFLATGTLASLMGLTGAPIFSAIFQGLLTSRLPDYLPSIFLNYASDLAATMLQALITPVLWQGLIMAVIGLMMLLIGYFVKASQTR